MAKTNATCQIRVQLAPDQHRAIRIAAAVTNRSMAEFAREATLSVATKAMKDFAPPSVSPQRRAPKPRPH